MNAVEQARTLAAMAQQKAHLEAVRRLQLAFTKELQAAGVKGADLNNALSMINTLVGEREDIVGTEYDEVLFQLTK
ncbi:hypothetical protein AH156_19935 [Salmonella enterica subsp. enterica serovar Enteritidis]|nr:hypothetical protein [Salmonella enterica subsp. enterica serovar Enteritidis]